jgi:hypothetical protein
VFVCVGWGGGVSGWVLQPARVVDQFEAGSCHRVGGSLLPPLQPCLTEERERLTGRLITAGVRDELPSDLQARTREQSLFLVSGAVSLPFCVISQRAVSHQEGLHKRSGCVIWCSAAPHDYFCAPCRGLGLTPSPRGYLEAGSWEGRFAAACSAPSALSPHLLQISSCSATSLLPAQVGPILLLTAGFLYLPSYLWPAVRRCWLCPSIPRCISLPSPLPSPPSLSLSLSLAVPLTFWRGIESKGGFSLLGECICVGGFLSTEHSLRLPFSLRSFHCRLLLLVLVSLFLSLPPSLVMRSSTRFLSAFSFED